MKRHSDPGETVTYQIQVQGRLDADWSDWFSGMSITVGEHGITTLTGPVTDQAILRGILCKLWDLNLTLISVLKIQ